MTSIEVGSKVILEFKGHLGVIELLVKFLKNSHCIQILCCITMGVGHNDPCVEWHMRHQHMLGQRSSKGHLR